MGSFLRHGKRRSEVINNKRAKKHTKEFYKILGELNDVALNIKENEDLETVTEDTIGDIASKYTTRVLGRMEQSILLSKLNTDGDNI